MAAAARIVVAGAGPAGSLIAHILANKGRDVVLIDGGKNSPDRIEMLPPAALAAFAAAGIGPLLSEFPIAVPCLGIVRGGAREDFLSQPGGRGLAVDRLQFDARLRDLALRTGANLRRARVVSAAAHPDRIDLILSGACGTEVLAADILVDATGRPAAAARRLGATVTTLERLTARPTAWSGSIGPWLAFAASSNGWRYAITGPERLEAWEVSAVPQGANTQVSVDASARYLEPAAGRRWIAIGDAAAAFDPISCQGLAHAAGTAVAAAGLVLSDGLASTETVEAYSFALRETALATEQRRRAVYARLRRAADGDSTTVISRQ